MVERSATVNNSLNNGNREYVVNFIPDSLIIDGLLNEAEWSFAPFTELFVINSSGSLPSSFTKARLLWSTKYLYCAFIVYDKDIWSTMDKRDNALWKEEAIEIFIGPEHGRKDYIELEINSLGTVLDLYMDKPYSQNGRADIHWNIKGLRFALSINGTLNDNIQDSSWTCEIAIPFKALKVIYSQEKWIPLPGDKWRINLCRIERNRPLQGMMEATSWSQTGLKTFHYPEKFGQIIFSDD